MSLPKRQAHPPKYLPFKVGDKVVFCPSKSDVSTRGQVFAIVQVLDHLSVMVEPAAAVISGLQIGYPASAHTYHLRSASDCHRCVHRMKHLMGAVCPASWKEVKFIEDKNEQNQ